MLDLVVKETGKILKVATDGTEIMMRKTGEETRLEKELGTEMLRTDIKKEMKEIAVEVIGENEIVNIGKTITGMMKKGMIAIAREKTIAPPDEKMMTQKELAAVAKLMIKE